MERKGLRLVVKDEDTYVPCIPSARVTLAFLQFLGCICLYLMRVNVGVAILCMTEGNDQPNTTVVPPVNATTPSYHVISEFMTSDSTMFTTEHFNYSDVFIMQSELSAIETEKPRESFHWDRHLQGWILSSFFVGYLLTQLLGGWVTWHVGAKWPIFCGISIITVASFLSPAAARYSPYALIAVQVIKGIGCGPFYPSLMYMWGYWAPPFERSKLNAFAMSGSAIGSVLSFFFSGLLCKYGFDGGWPSVFYVYGLVSLVWLLLWALLVFDTPTVHPRISRSEKDYIQQSLGPFGNSQFKTPPIPWKQILTSMPFYAIILTDFAYGWGWYTIQTNIPSYMETVLKFSISTNGALSSIPYLANWVVVMVASTAADHLIKSNTFSVTCTRKIMTTLGLVIPAIFIVAVGYLNESHSTLAVVCLTVALGFMGCVRAGHIVNQLDIAPRFGGVIMGFANSVGTIAGIIAPSAATSLTPTGSQEEWQRVFFLCGGIYILGWLIYIVFGRGELQPWAVVADDTDVLEENVPYEKNAFHPDLDYTSSPRVSPTPSNSEESRHFENEAYTSATALGKQYTSINAANTSTGDSIF